ncbi:N-acetylmannosamine-6-phosphate 2-epimerase [Rothia nasimurium]|uniref:N-acetylmannosamine-6-phosphate 2-epimerase n=1 Tax=Rothia nasimurium TaxID=85336 RepID=UPI002DD6517B|nr:N-acetylmannosamine-6-phosphate 2-epimerase [Rothia nasimurium]
MFTLDQLTNLLAGQLIVSAQAYPGEPMRDPRTTGQVAASAVLGGAAAVRVQGLADIQFTRTAVEVPVIGLWKDGHHGIFITPTLHHALAVAQAGAHIVALDGTLRERPDGLSLGQVIQEVQQNSPALVMADCDSLESAQAAADAGADFIGTTLAGYTDARPKTAGPDLELLEAIADLDLGVPLIAEGRIHTPAQARQALEAGAHAVVVGTAITHPISITGWFTEALKG